MQSVARRKFEKVRHWSTYEVRMRRSAVAPAIDVGLHHLARGINVITINTGAMLFVFANNLKATSRSAISFSTARYPRRRDSVPSTVGIGFLFAQSHND